MSERVILEELAPTTQLFLEEEAAYIESSKAFTDDDVQIDKQEFLFANTLGRELNSFLPQLFEQDLIEITDGKIKIPYSTFKYLYKNDESNMSEEISGFGMSDVLPGHSPFLINIDSYRDLGSPDFQYECKFNWGVKEVFPKRYGCFLKLRQKFYYLEDNLFNLLSKIDSFNALETSKKDKKTNLKYFAEIKELINKINTTVKTDTYINNENVIIPNKIKLNIVEDGDKISVMPLIDGVEFESFKTQFEGIDEIQDIYDTDNNGSRVRAILSDDIKEVAKKIKTEYSNVSGNQKDKILLDPRKIISEIEGIDQDIVDYEGYGERVKGIGEYAFKPKMQFRSSGVGFLEAINNFDKADIDFDLESDVMPIVVAENSDGEDIEITLTAETISKISEAIAENKVAVEISDEEQTVKIPITNEVKEFVKDHNDIFSTKISKEEKQKKICKYLIIHDNFDEQTYSEFINKSKTKQLSYERPLSLKDYITDKKNNENPLELYDYQKEGIAWLQASYESNTKNGVLLADDMGLGKTLQVLSFLAWLIEKKEKSGEKIKPILVVAPPILLQNWRDEIKKFFQNDGSIFEPVSILHGSNINSFKKYNISGKEQYSCEPSLCVDCSKCECWQNDCCKINKISLANNRIVITNYDTAKNYQFSLGKIKWSAVLLDEAQYIKEPETSVALAVKTLDADFKLTITGTPVENKLLDLWSIMDFAYPGILGTKKEFSKVYDIDPQKTSPEERENRLNLLKQKLKLSKFNGLDQQCEIPYVVRRDKAEYLADKLPKKYDGEDAIRITCPMPPEMETMHDAILGQLTNETNKKHHLVLLQQLVKLYQHPLLLNKSKLNQPLDAHEYIKTSPKLRATLEQLRKIRENEEKVLIFVTSRTMQNILKTVIDAEFNLNIGIINGTVNNNISKSGCNSSGRFKILNDFENKEGFNVLLLSPHVAGVGLTILGANHVIHYGRWWNPAKEVQATDRAYRIGQKKEVRVYYPIYESLNFETFDEKLDRLIESKKALARDFLTPIENLTITSDDILFDKPTTINLSSTKTSTINIDELCNLDFKKMVYLLLKKDTDKVDCFDEKQNMGIDFVAYKGIDKYLIQILSREINEKTIEEFTYIIDKYNRNGINYLYVNSTMSKELLTYAQDNKIEIIDKSKIIEQLKKINLSEENILSAIIDIVPFNL